MNHDNKTTASNIVTAETCDRSGLRPLSNEGVMRRDWLKNVMIGGMGLSLFGIPMPSLADDPAIKGCPRIIRVSKNLEARIYGYKCESCMCGKDQVFMVTFDFKGPVLTNQACDESINMIPDKSIVKGSLRYTLRSARCPETRKPILSGCHEGKFMLYSPSGKPLFAAPISGTQGVNPDASGAKRCCWPHGEGSLRGKGTEEMKNCMICASYHLKVPFNQYNPCTKTPPKELYMQLDGSLMCPC